jgi:hypothetical protein
LNGVGRPVTSNGNTKSEFSSAEVRDIPVALELSFKGVIFGSGRGDSNYVVNVNGEDGGAG